MLSLYFCSCILGFGQPLMLKRTNLLFSLFNILFKQREKVFCWCSFHPKTHLTLFHQQTGLFWNKTHSPNYVWLPAKVASGLNHTNCNPEIKNQKSWHFLTLVICSSNTKGTIDHRCTGQVEAPLCKTRIRAMIQIKPLIPLFKHREAWLQFAKQAAEPQTFQLAISSPLKGAKSPSPSLVLTLSIFSRPWDERRPTTAAVAGASGRWYSESEKYW